jgi:hypothetical protein
VFSIGFHLNILPTAEQQSFYRQSRQALQAGEIAPASESALDTAADVLRHLYHINIFTMICVTRPSNDGLLNQGTHLNLSKVFLKPPLRRLRPHPGVVEGVKKSIPTGYALTATGDYSVHLGVEFAGVMVVPLVADF